ncbi:MAG: thrombospondin type 3 repeat-containing protein [Phycisphaerales bacterium]|nr:MAG: thrombospondin type 3 repeat-containing protein [Phycisphaerales bacterium]
MSIGKRTAVATLCLLLMGSGLALALQPLLDPAVPRALMDPPPRPSAGSGAELAEEGMPRWITLDDFVPGQAPPPLLQSDPIQPDDRGLRTPAPRTNWTGVVNNPATIVPPDTHIAVGPNLGAAGRVVEVTNSDVQIWDKTGAVIAGPTPLSTMFPPSVGPFPFDPKVLYDQHSGHFFIVCLEGNTPAGNLIHIAASTGSTPNSLGAADWTFSVGSGVQVIGGTPTWADYPGIGADANALFVTTNQFTGAPVAFRGANIRVFNKAQLIAGFYTFVDITYDALVTWGVATIQPAHVYGATDNGGMYLINRIGAGTYRIYNVTGHPAAPVATTSTHPWAAGAFPADTGADQGGVALPDLDTLSSRVQNAVYRGTLWCCLTSNPDGDAETEVVWQEINTAGGPPAAPFVVQAGFIQGTGVDNWTYMPSINVNAAGDAALSFTQSAWWKFPDFSYTMRLATDPPGTFQAEVVALASAGFYDSFVPNPIDRWGDFSGCVVDPTDDCFWVANEFANTSVVGASTWGTQIASFCSTPPIAACCASKTACAMLDQATCLAQGWVWRGPPKVCPTQNVQTNVHQGIAVVHWTTPGLDCYTMKKHLRGCIDGELIDAWMTDIDPDLGQEMCHSFDGVDPCSPPLPADFFGPGSDPFEGHVCLRGEPLGPTTWGDYDVADTLVQRDIDPFDRCELDYDNPRVVTAQIVALNLVSTDPITVTYDGGLDPELWDVAVDLSVQGSPSGTVTATRTHCNGGYYASNLPVQPRFTFTKVSDPAVTRELDTGLAGLCPINLAQDDNPAWSSDLDPNFNPDSPWCSDFHPAIEEPMPTTDCDCQPNGIRDDCEIEDGFSSDCNANGIPDECDPDTDLDTVTDDCDNCPYDPNPGQLDSDGDEIGDVCDLCPTLPELLEDDEDGDKVRNAADNCPCVVNPDQTDSDGDEIGDACDTAGCPCGDIDQSGGPVDLNDFASFALCFGLTGPGGSCAPVSFDCSDMDANGSVDLNDFATFALTFGLASSNTVPNCP